MKKNMLKIIVISFIFCFIPTMSYASSWPTHKLFWNCANEIEVEKGGFGKFFSKPNGYKIMHLLHTTIDGNGGGKHRHDGSHNPLILFNRIRTNSLLVNLTVIPKRIIINAVIIHNLVDMADPGTDGTNGWKCNPKRRAEAIKLLQGLQKSPKQGFTKAPKWAVKIGSEILPSSGVKPELPKPKKHITNTKKGVVKRFFNSTKSFVSKTVTKVDRILPKGIVTGIYGTYKVSKHMYQITTSNTDIVWKDEAKKAAPEVVGIATTGLAEMVSPIV
jgi:hypothetical protein